MNLVYEILSERPISVNPLLVEITGSHSAAFFLAQCMYWHKRMGREFHKTNESWQKELRMSKQVLTTARRDCQKFVITTKKGLPARNYYDINMEAVEKALAESLQSDEKLVRLVGRETGTTTTENTTENTLVSKDTRASLQKQAAIFPYKSQERGDLETGLEDIEGGSAADPLLANTLRVPRPQGRPDINEVIHSFEETMGLKLKRLPQQRFAAKRLIDAYGRENTLKAIPAVYIIRDEKFAPQILNVEDLWEKWDKLVAYYRKKQKEQTSKITVIED